MERNYKLKHQPGEILSWDEEELSDPVVFKSR